MDIGYIGNGALAAVAVRRLAEHHRVLAFSPAQDCPLDGTRARAAANLAEVARSSNVVIICLQSQSAVRDLLLGSEPLAQAFAPATIIVDQTPGDPAETRVIADQLRTRHVVMLDAPIHCERMSAMPEASAILCGGPLDAVQSVRTMLEAICPAVVHCGDTGSGQAARLVVAAVAACNRLITYECATVGVKNGLTIDHMAAVLDRSSGSNSATARVLPVLATTRPTTDIPLATVREDLTMASRLAMRSGAPMLVANLVCAMVESAGAQLGADATLDALARTFEAGAGIRFQDANARPAAR